MPMQYLVHPKFSNIGIPLWEIHTHLLPSKTKHANPVPQRFEYMI